MELADVSVGDVSLGYVLAGALGQVRFALAGASSALPSPWLQVTLKYCSMITYDILTCRAHTIVNIVYVPCGDGFMWFVVMRCGLW